MVLEDKARVLWAKSDRGQESGSWLPLWCHLLDVAACAWEILELEPESTLRLYGDDFQCVGREATLALVCALVALHDLGKASPAFQQKSESCRLRVFAAGLDWGKRAPTAPPRDVPHGAVTRAALERLLRSEWGWSAKAADQVAQAVGMHHGWPIGGNELQDAGTRCEAGGKIWDELRLELFRFVMQVLGVSEPAVLEDFEGFRFQRLAGLTSFADWVGSSLEFGDASLSGEDYWRVARERARSRLEGLGWRKRSSFCGEFRDFEEMFGYLGTAEAPFVARPLQKEMAELVEAVDAPTLLLVEAPMGEGKTEAGLFASVELQRQLDHRGVYVALPTKATGNAMFSRTLGFLNSLGREIPIDLHLLHGTTLLNRDYQELKYRTNLVGDDGGGESDLDGVTAEHYFSNRKRALLAEAGVGTVDQALIGILPVKHQFVRLWGLGNRVVLFDEIHAYDTYTGTLIDRLLEWLYRQRSSVVLMSATLPRERRRALLSKWMGNDEAGESFEGECSYPRITRVSGGRVEQRSFEARPQKRISLQAHSAELEFVAEALLEQTLSGGCAVCIVNTVDRAQNLYRLLKGRVEDLTLFHARFPLRQRQRLEDEVLAKFGKDRSRRPRRAILVATQVAEQSLDLDFDVMFSDLAPIDLILQRAGRLHRHSHNDGRRHGHDEARVWVLGLERSEQPPDLKAYFWDRIYSSYVLLRTWWFLRGRTSIHLQYEIDDAISGVYGEEPVLPAHLQGLLSSAKERLETKMRGQSDVAHYSNIGEPDGLGWQNRRGSDLDEGLEPNTQAVTTRLGQASLTILPVYCREDRYFLERQGEREIKMVNSLTREMAEAAYLETVSTSRFELTRALTIQPWKKTALLKGVSVLYLNERGECQIAGLEVRVDAELGLVYRSLSSAGGKS